MAQSNHQNAAHTLWGILFQAKPAFWGRLCGLVGFVIGYGQIYLWQTLFRRSEGEAAGSDRRMGMMEHERDR